MSSGMSERDPSRLLCTKSLTPGLCGGLGRRLEFTAKDIRGRLDKNKSGFHRNAPECARPRAQQCSTCRRPRNFRVFGNKFVAAPGDGRTPLTNPFRGNPSEISPRRVRRCLCRSVSVPGHSNAEYANVFDFSGVSGRKSVAAPGDGRTPHTNPSRGSPSEIFPNVFAGVETGVCPSRAQQCSIRERLRTFKSLGM